jgi:hypothetical protein
MFVRAWSRASGSFHFSIVVEGEGCRILVLGLLGVKQIRARGDGSGRVVRNAAGETLEVNAH